MPVDTTACTRCHYFLCVSKRLHTFSIIIFAGPLKQGTHSVIILEVSSGAWFLSACPKGICSRWFFSARFNSAFFPTIVFTSLRHCSLSPWSHIASIKSIKYSGLICRRFGLSCVSIKPPLSSIAFLIAYSRYMYWNYSVTYWEFSQYKWKT